MADLSNGHIFISYSRRDTDAMLRIVSYLRGQGLKVWIDNEKLVPGTPIWEKEIEKALDKASAVVVVLSPDAKESIWVLNELTLADEFKKRVFPVLVRGEFKDSIPFRLVTRQFVDLRMNETLGLESLSKALIHYLDKLNSLEDKRQKKELAPEKVETEHLFDKLEADEKREVERLQQGQNEKKMVVDENVDSTKLDTIHSQTISLQSWKGRSLLGGVLGAMIGMFSLILYTLEHGWRAPGLISMISVLFVLIIVGGFTGAIIYPHKIVIFLLLIGVIIVENIYYNTTARYTNTPPLETFALYVVMGALFGIPPAALLSRIMYLVKILK